MKKKIIKKTKKTIEFFDERSLGAIPRVFLSSIVVIGLFYIMPLLANFANENFLNTKEFQNQSKKILVYTLNSKNNIEEKIIKILDQKIRPAVARDGGDIKFREFKDGIVKVQLQGSCSGCPSSTMTLKQGVQNLLCHYLPEVKEVIAVQ